MVVEPIWDDQETLGEEARARIAAPWSAGFNRWWSARRRHYNIGLVIAGITDFIAYLIVLSVFSEALWDVEVTVFTTAFQAFAYLVCMALANACYQLGTLSERWLHPKNPTVYRHVTFALGFWFSVALPFSVPVLLVILALLHPHLMTLEPV
jgi:hypothetical protein